MVVGLAQVVDRSSEQHHPPEPVPVLLHRQSKCSQLIVLGGVQHPFRREEDVGQMARQPHRQVEWLVFFATLCKKFLKHHSPFSSLTGMNTPPPMRRLPPNPTASSLSESSADRS